MINFKIPNMKSKLSLVANGVFLTKEVEIPHNMASDKYFNDIVNRMNSVSNDLQYILFEVTDNLFTYYNKERNLKLSGALTGNPNYNILGGIITPAIVSLHKQGITNVPYNEIDWLTKHPIANQFLPIRSTKNVEAFMNHIINVLNINFHPDDNFSDYLDEEGFLIDIYNNKIYFSQTGIDFVEALIQDSFKIVGDEVYEYGAAILKIRLAEKDMDLDDINVPDLSGMFKIKPEIINNIVESISYMVLEKNISKQDSKYIKVREIVKLHCITDEQIDFSKFDKETGEKFNNFIDNITKKVIELHLVNQAKRPFILPFEAFELFLNLKLAYQAILEYLNSESSVNERFANKYPFGASFEDLGIEAWCDVFLQNEPSYMLNIIPKTKPKNLEAAVWEFAGMLDKIDNYLNDFTTKYSRNEYESFIELFTKIYPFQSSFDEIVLDIGHWATEFINTEKKTLIFSTALGDAVYTDLELALGAGVRYKKPHNYTVGQYQDKFVITTNNRASIFMKQDDFKILGSFLPDGTFYKNRETEDEIITPESGRVLLTNQPKPGDKYYALQVMKGTKKYYFNWGAKTLSIHNLKRKPIWYIKEVVDMGHAEAKEFFEGLGFVTKLIEKTF
jgi:hypothetical protein